MPALVSLLERRRSSANRGNTAEEQGALGSSSSSSSSSKHHHLQAWLAHESAWARLHAYHAADQAEVPSINPWPPCLDGAAVTNCYKLSNLQWVWKWSNLQWVSSGERDSESLLSTFNHSMSPWCICNANYISFTIITRLEVQGGLDHGLRTHKVRL